MKEDKNRPPRQEPPSTPSLPEDFVKKLKEIEERLKKSQALLEKLKRKH